MSANRDHHSSKEQKFQILVIPQGDAGERRSFGLTMRGLAGLLLGLIVVTLGIVIVLLGYTPLGRVIPVSDAEIQRRYGNQLYELQTRLGRVTEEVIVMREYNRKLRSALGEDLESDTSSTAELDDTKLTAPAAQGQESASPERAVVEAPARSENTPTYVVDQSHQTVGRPFQATFPVYPPVVGYVSRGFDEARKHFGIDYAGRRGAIVSSAADGYVVFAGWTFDDGNMMILSHGGGYFTIYKHNQALLKSTNEFVKRGQPIALLGNSGNTSYGPHLHFELWKDGQPQNPDEYLIATESL